MKDSPKQKIECSNCGGYHPAFSKRCQKMIEETNFIVEAQKKQTSKKVTGQQNLTTSYNQKFEQKVNNTNNHTNANINAVLVSIIANLSFLIGSKKLDMSSLVKINTTIENLSKLINE
ncbi:unnamed protein product [Brachionus calyciflorus]|uniref:Uncharacterized protein n=1 Tax=Brachionus calyciflorus TaxID=104777 RepID=A0A814PWU6_9BILA|nr:unnamed protein product [Brachionus calyciflorus]